MRTDLLGYFVADEDVVLVAQGVGAASKGGGPGLLGMPNISNGPWKHPLYPRATAQELPGTCREDSLHQPSLQAS